MWPLIVLGIGALIANAFSEEDENPRRRNQTPRKSTSDGKKKIFVSFAIEDSKYRDFLVAQAKNERSPFSFVDMSVKEPWDQQV